MNQLMPCKMRILENGAGTIVYGHQVSPRPAARLSMLHASMKPNEKRVTIFHLQPRESEYNYPCIKYKAIHNYIYI